MLVACPVNEPVMVTLLKLVWADPGIVVVPLNITVPVPAVNVPPVLWVQFPEIFMVPEPASKVPPAKVNPPVPMLMVLAPSDIVPV